MKTSDAGILIAILVLWAWAKADKAKPKEEPYKGGIP